MIRKAVALLCLSASFFFYPFYTSGKGEQTLKSGSSQISSEGFTDAMEENPGSFTANRQNGKEAKNTTVDYSNVEIHGTLKSGNFNIGSNPDVAVNPKKEGLIPLFPEKVVIYSLIAFLLCAFAVSIYGLFSVIADSARIHRDVRALISGDTMPSRKKKHHSVLKKKGAGLRFKFVFFTGILVFSVVILVSIPLGLRFTKIQEKTLVNALQIRLNVLLESLASGAKAYLPGHDLLELSFLPGQSSSVPEALSAVITGPSIDGSEEGTNFVWACNDPDIVNKIDTPEYIPGVSRLVFEASKQIEEKNAYINKHAFFLVSNISVNISRLSKEAESLSLKTDSDSITRKNEIQNIILQLEEELTTRLKRISFSATESYPHFDPENLSPDITHYIFYKPVLYRQAGSSSYVHGNVIVEISTKEMFTALAQEYKAVIMITAYTALVALLIGMTGSLFLAYIIISPIRHLAAHVAMIRDTEDKSLLEGKSIKLRSRDEIGLLGETVNEMTNALVSAALAAKELTVGKETQKMFIPLETNENGRKLTSGEYSDGNADFFGYYEGAEGVSGDYFDYKKLDERHYAIIKCDVAGKGVPAALIMVEIATIFLDFFKDWDFVKNRYDISPAVSRINDLVESKGFKGRFAAFTMCLFDSESGDVYFCNAGDNIVHIYDASEKKLKTHKLQEVSAAGVFPTSEINAKGGYKVEKLHLAPGDVLFLYTDGIEEAKRFFRTPDFKQTVCSEKNSTDENFHGNHRIGQDNEEFTYDRVKEIIEAVFKKEKFTLKKCHNPEGENTEYTFDFSNCDGTVEDAVIALVSIEKIFRIYKDTTSPGFYRVQADRKIDAFLQKCFEQYDEYCSLNYPHPEYEEYLYYENLKEDPQYDDLTILGIKKN